MKKGVVIASQDFEETKKDILDAGIENFHVIADFDRTLTKAFLKGQKKVGSMISQLRDGRYLTEDYASRAHALFDEYHPIEISADVPLEEKKEKMQEWWAKHFELLIECGLNKDTIKTAVENMIKEDTLVFREGVGKFLDFLKDNDIPLVIMSSSIGDMIVEFLKQKELYYDNVYVIANLLDFDDEGNATGIKKIVHVFNKSETEVKVHEVQDRKNVLLLGDSLGDLGMIEGFDTDNLIAIGFLNESPKENLEKFKELYDVVLLGDPDFNFVNNFLDEF